MSSRWSFAVIQPKRASPMKREGKKNIKYKNAMSPGHHIGGVYEFYKPLPHSEVSHPQDTSINQLKQELKVKDRELNFLKGLRKQPLRFRAISTNLRNQLVRLKPIHQSHQPDTPIKVQKDQTAIEMSNPITGNSVHLKKDRRFEQDTFKFNLSPQSRNPITGDFVSMTPKQNFSKKQYFFVN